MSDNSLAFRLTTDTFSLDGSNQRTKEQVNTPNLLYVYTPESDVTSIKDVLNRNQIPHVINHYNIRDYRDKTLCFCKISDLNDQQLNFLVNAASAGARVEALLDHMGKRLNFVETELLHADYLLEKNQRQPLTVNTWQKRLLDVGVSLLLLTLSLPIWLLTALAIKLESPGPVFFQQRRTGLFNQEFSIFKFRSMCVDAEKDGARWASKNDSRITRVGNFIRKTRIDELPQLLNVLRGEMSIVGPRPEREVFIHDLEKQIPFYRFRHTVKPGVTGLAQVRYTYGASVEDAMHKHRHDIYYIKHQNFWMDVRILLDTVRIVLTGQGV
ncbi:exopolysaccharide biosynthesis polyprenyl glycosylphosphotransferase [Thiothrix lacustris]|uniref:Exopolysaccharide biosynthesis polyprenyl glycosylphosphotransferase n=1 Tax=Thiothrix lacustris TaxID=525917 RepID=A0ABY9MR89_9GAMM|nr:exopolysaccharide biosynthesis polyprenyl glycosylphosphotransferase [Thiothrix lacustris]WML91165.1 exopolysaccharide biosynthesis polyprenyl glycosylphosphotransferase [Thiothrix lacustris]